MSEAPQTLTKGEFAKHIGCVPSYVSKLGREGRLVLADDGRVMVAETKAKMASATRAPERASEAAQTVVGGDSRDRKAFYEAESARLDLEERIGKLLDRAEVVSVVAEVATMLRQTLTSRSAMMAPQLAAAGGDEARIKTLLLEHDEQTLAEVSRRFSKLSEEAAE